MNKYTAYYRETCALNYCLDKSAVGLFVSDSLNRIMYKGYEYKIKPLAVERGHGVDINPVGSVKRCQAVFFQKVTYTVQDAPCGQEIITFVYTQNSSAARLNQHRISYIQFDNSIFRPFIPSY